MNGSKGPAQERVRNEASDWFARMRGEPTEAERDELERWLGSDPAHRQAYERLTAQWEHTAFLARAPTVRGRNLAKVGLQASRTAGVAKIYAGVAVAAAVALALALTVVAATQGPIRPASPVAYENEGGGNHRVRLTDGSDVTLGPDSRIHIAFDDGQRHVGLLHGRARFTVAHDASRPFAVAAGGGTIVALGTVFEVAIDDRRVRIMLHEGSVEVRRPPSGNYRRSQRATTVLAPGEATSFAGIAAKSAVTSSTAAHAGMASFRHTPLAKAAAAFGSGGQQAIRLAPDVAELRVTGTFRRDDPEAFARATAAIFELALTREGDVWILSKQ